MHIRNQDLNLLGVASALYRHQNVSKAAASLGMTQSALSHALARLRVALNDPLFVRSSRGITPTDYAKSIRKQICDIIRQAETLYSEKTAFDPKLATGRITIATTDYFEAITMPELLPTILKEAPQIQISIRPTLGAFPKSQLEDGEYDMAVAGFYTHLPEGFYQKSLFTDAIVCGYREGHPRIGLGNKKKLTIEDFFNEDHALITLQGDFDDQIHHAKSNSVPLSCRREKRHFSYGSFSFTGMAWTLSKSDLLITAPQKLLECYQKIFPVKISPCPVPLDPIHVKMFWHERTHMDPLKAWVRGKIKEFWSPS